MNLNRAAAAIALLLAGCEEVPDHCLDYERACIGVTVDSGPQDVYRLRVTVMDGFAAPTLFTPKKTPDSPLVYPLRFGIRFGEFDDRFVGAVTILTEAYNDELDIVGQTTTKVEIRGFEKKNIDISLSPPLAEGMP